MSEDVPEGQMLRDPAFWRTYWAVEREFGETRERAERKACTHTQVTWTHESLHCDACGAERDQVLAKWRAMGLRVVEHDDGALEVSQP